MQFDICRNGKKRDMAQVNHGLPFDVREHGAAIDGCVADRAQIMSELTMCSRYAREHTERYTAKQVFGGIRERIHADPLGVWRTS